MNSECEGKGFASYIGSWLLSCLVASLVPGLLSLLDKMFPDVFLDGSEFCCSGIGLGFSLHVKSLVFVAATGIIFWGIGLLLSPRASQTLSGIREALANHFSKKAIAELIFVVPLLFAIQTLDVTHGRIWLDTWWIGKGAYGNWGQVVTLKAFTILALLLPVDSCLFGLLSLCLKRSEAGFLVSALSLAAACVGLHVLSLG